MASNIQISSYSGEHQLPEMAGLIDRGLSEPYTVFTYRYFLTLTPSVSLVAYDTTTSEMIGVIICKLEPHRTDSSILRGYIGMLAVDPKYRNMGIGTMLVRASMAEMKRLNADEVVLETELSNTAAQALYERLGFVKDKRMYRYYMNGSDAFRLKYWFDKDPSTAQSKAGSSADAVTDDEQDQDGNNDVDGASNEAQA
eukprot:jgi/Hompol1/2092/HPOL_003558-RA